MSQLVALPDTVIATAPGARPCPACGATGGALVHELSLRAPDGHPLERGYPVACCGTCSCGFADVDVDPSYYARYYAELAKYATETAGSLRGPVVDPRWMSEKADASAARLSSMVGDRATRILDLGCATGTVLGALARLGHESLVGVDPAPASVRVAAARQGVEAYVGDAGSIPADIGRFGCVSMTGVLEHLFDPLAALQAACAVLEPRGLIYVEVPDASGYLDPYVAPFEDFNTEHVNHFSIPCLEVLGARCGLEVVRAERVQSELAPGIEAAHAVVGWRRLASGRAGSRGAPLRRPPVRRDVELESVLHDYAARSLADLARVDVFLEDRLGGERELGIWGIGEAAFKLLALGSLSSRKLSALADANPARFGLRIGGVAVGAPETIAPAGLPIVVASFLRSASILESARHIGLPNPLVTLEGWRER